MAQKTSKLFTMLFLAGVQFCTGEQTTDSITAYHCTPEFAETMSEISPTDRVLRVCISGASSAIDCQKVVEATITQESKSIEERLVIAGQQQVAFARTAEIRTEKKKCMVSIRLGDNHFVKSSSTASLQVVISGSVSVSAAIASSNATAASSGASHLRAEPAEGIEELFSLSVSLTSSDVNSEPNKPITNDKLDAAPSSVTAYQCTSDYVEVIDPPAISSEGRMLRVCIAGVASAIECQKVVEATITQASKHISDRLVVSGQQQAAEKDKIEVTTQGGKCMIAALLTDKYFIKSSSAGSLEVIMSGVVSVTSTSGRRHLRARPAEGSKVSFEIPVSLTRMGGDSEEYEQLPTPQAVDGATSIYGIAVGVAAVVMMLI